MVVKQERRGGTLLLTVDRPDTRNAISDEVARALCSGIKTASTDAAVHAVVLCSTGDIFLSGGDLKQLRQLPLDAGGAARVLALGIELGAIERCPVPVIAAIDGDTFGGGCELALMCDLLVMERSAGLRFVHARMGLVPAWGGATRLHERVGAAHAADILLTARRISAGEAQGMGLAARVVDDGEAVNEALRIGEGLATIDRAALTNMKATLLELRNTRRGDAFDRERKVFRNAWGSAQHRAAFEV